MSSLTTSSVVLMLTHLYSANIKPTALPRKDEARPRTNGNMNGHARVPNAEDRQAADAQEFELEGLMSDDDDAEGGAGAGKLNGRAR